MQKLSNFRKQSKGLPDLLNWGALVDKGVILCKDGSLLTGYFFRGNDISTSTDNERNYITNKINSAFSIFGTGWATWTEAIRLNSVGYPKPEDSYFTNIACEMIDNERRKQFENELAHFESEHILFISYTPPLERNTKIQSLVWTEEDKNNVLSSAEKVLRYFNKTLDEMEDTIGDTIKLKRMSSFTITDNNNTEHVQDELVNALHFILTGEETGLNIPPYGMYLDGYIGCKDLWTGDTPLIGDDYLACICIDGFPSHGYPNILERLEHLPIQYRWSTRMLYLDKIEALAELKKYKRHWAQKVRGFVSQLFKINNQTINEDALLMASMVNDSITDAESDLVKFGYYTSVVILRSKKRDELLESARFITREIKKLGFSCRLEDVNSMETWLGSLPGHTYPNIRRPLIHTLNLADLLPLSNVWPGLPYNPCPFYPEESPPLMYTATIGSTPFRLNLHVNDLGHTLIFGPTGAGKSFLLATIILSFQRYKNASIFAFDKGRSMYTATQASLGSHIDISLEADNISLAPLSIELETPSGLLWAEDWLETCYTLQTNQKITPQQKDSIHTALVLLSKQPKENRSLTEFCYTVQDENIRLALKPYTLDGSLGRLLDNQLDRLDTSTVTTFEIEELMHLGEKNVIPILTYIFRRFEKSLKGQPALLVLDEAWIMLGHPLFKEKIREWLKVLRKANCAVVMATQSLTDALKSGIFDVLVESCPTKILLPNEEAYTKGTENQPGSNELYLMMGLNEKEIDIIHDATKKKQYYVTSPEGKRLFDLGVTKNSVLSAIAGVSDKEELAIVQKLIAEDSSDWIFKWLDRKGVNYGHLIN